VNLLEILISSSSDVMFPSHSVFTTKMNTMINLNRNLLLFISLVLASCESDEGLDNGSYKTIWLIIGVIMVSVFFIGIYEGNEKSAKKKELNKTYGEAFMECLRKNNIISSNCIYDGCEYGLSVSNDLKTLAYFTGEQYLHLFNSDLIHSVDCRYGYNQIMKSKSNTPIITWNTIANTNSTINQNFAFADLTITIRDVSLPFVKVRFYSEAEAERYYSLIKLMISEAKQIKEGV
jgi:hypothetical protein